MILYILLFLLRLAFDSGNIVDDKPGDANEVRFARESFASSRCGRFRDFPVGVATTSSPSSVASFLLNTFCSKLSTLDNILLFLGSGLTLTSGAGTSGSSSLVSDPSVGSMSSEGSRLKFVAVRATVFAVAMPSVLVGKRASGSSSSDDDDDDDADCCDAAERFSCLI